MTVYSTEDLFGAFTLLLKNKTKEFKRCNENPKLFCHSTHHNGRILVFYCFKEGKNSSAVAAFISSHIEKESLVFNLFYSVKPTLQGKGLGSAIVEAAIAQFIIDFSKATTTPHYDSMLLTTYVPLNNLVSQKISRKFISQDSVIVRDSMTGEPQYYYKRLVKF